jgi:hypothetical protein
VVYAFASILGTYRFHFPRIADLPRVSKKSSGRKIHLVLLGLMLSLVGANPISLSPDFCA